MNSLKREKNEEWLGQRIVGRQNFADPPRVQMGGVFALVIPGDGLPLMEVEATEPGTVTGVIGIVVHAARQGAEVRVEATAGG